MNEPNQSTAIATVPLPLIQNLSEKSFLISPEVMELLATIQVVSEKALKLRVTDETTLATVNVALVDVKTVLLRINRDFDPIIAAFNQAHKISLKAKEHTALLPLQAEKHLKEEIGNWNRLVDLKRQGEENERLRAIALAQKVVDEKVKEAAKAEKAGRPLEAAGHMVEAEQMETVARAAAAAPISFAPKPKFENVAQKEIWKYHIVNMALIPTEFKITSLDEVKIQKVVNELHEAARTKIPGIEPYRDWAAGVAAKGRR